MAIPSRQIGWSTRANLLWQISKQLEYLTGVLYKGTTTTTTTATPTTTTTTTTAAVLSFIGRVGSSSNDACNGVNVTLYTTGPLVSGNYPQSGIIVYSDPALTQPITSAYVSSPGIGQVWECFNGELYNQQSCG